MVSLQFSDLAKAFNLVSQEPNESVQVKQGESFKLSCVVNNYYKYCKFKHVESGNICDFEWERDVLNITVAECSNYEDRMVWSGNWKLLRQSGCSIEILDARQEDAGEWVCEIKSHAAAKYRGYGNSVTANYNIEIIPKPTTTTTEPSKYTYRLFHNKN